MPEYVVADTGAVLHLTRASEHSRAYNSFIGDRHLAINFQVAAEIQNWPPNLSESRKQRCEELLAVCLKLPISESTQIWYGRVATERARLGKLGDRARGAGDGDVWVISSALEYSLPLLSHDTAQVRLARALGLVVFTNLDGLRAENPPMPVSKNASPTLGS